MRLDLLGLASPTPEKLFYTATYIFFFLTTGHEYRDKCLKQCVLNSHRHSPLTHLTSGINSTTLPPILR